MSIKENFVTVQEAARIKGCSTQTILMWIRTGKLPAERLGGVYLIPRRALQEVSLTARGRPTTSETLRRIVREEIERVLIEKGLVSET